MSNLFQFSIQGALKVGMFNAYNVKMNDVYTTFREHDHYCVYKSKWPKFQKLKLWFKFENKAFWLAMFLFSSQISSCFNKEKLELFRSINLTKVCNFRKITSNFWYHNSFFKWWIMLLFWRRKKSPKKQIGHLKNVMCKFF